MQGNGETPPPPPPAPRRAGAIAGSTGTSRGAGAPVGVWVRPTWHQPTRVRSRHPPSISFPALGTPLCTRQREEGGKAEAKGKLGWGTKGRSSSLTQSWPIAQHRGKTPPATARLTPSSSVSPDREIPGEPRGDPQHVVQHQHGSEAALPQHARRGQLVGQRQPAHLDHRAETGECSSLLARTDGSCLQSCCKSYRQATISSGHELTSSLQTAG